MSGQCLGRASFDVNEGGLVECRNGGEGKWGSCEEILATKFAGGYIGACTLLDGSRYGSFESRIESNL